jgi:hypothetical protein
VSFDVEQTHPAQQGVMFAGLEGQGSQPYMIEFSNALFCAV